MSVIQNNLLMTPEGYQISRSVRLRSSASAYLNRTPASAGNRKTWTWSGWVKRGSISNSQDNLFGANGTGGVVSNSLRFSNGDGSQKLMIENYNGAGADYYVMSAAVYRDPSAWYHIVCTWDTTNATAADRLKLYVNGVQLTSITTGNAIPLNAESAINSAVAHYIGGTNYFDGYLTEVNFIDGQALNPSSFGETDAITGVWKPKKYAGTYGTNGFYLNFSDNSAATAATIGKDYSGNGNNWTPNNISVTAGVTYDSMLDVPTMWADGGNGRGNYCVVNPLSNGGLTIAQANLSISKAANSWLSCRASIGVSSGKWYWEYTSGAGASPVENIGIGNSSAPVSNLLGYDANGYAYNSYSGNKINNAGGGSGAAYGASFTSGDVIGVALDLDAGTLVFYKNGTSQGTAYSGLSGAFFPMFSQYGTLTGYANFGQRPFAYTPPTGFKALNTQNLPAGSITTSGSFTGNASSDGPFVYLNGVPTAMTINGNAVTFATHADRTAGGFKLRTSSSSYNASGSNTYSITTTGAKFKYANAQVNP